MQQKSELPEGWIWVTYEQIGTWSGGGTPSKSNSSYWEGGDILWISPKDMKTDIIKDTEDKITKLGLENSSAKLIPAHSLLFVVRSGILRRTLPIALTFFDSTVNQDIRALILANQINSNFILLCSQAFSEDIRKSCSKDGTTVESIEFSSLAKYKVPISPIAEQHRIVSAIEALFARLDATNEKLDSVLGILKKFRESVLAAACEGRLTEVWREENHGIKFKVETLDFIDLGSSVDSEVIFATFNLPDTWKWTTVDSIGHVKGGKRLQKGSSLVNYDTSHPYLRAGNLKNGTVEGEILYLQPNDYNKISKYTISSSDVYITIVGACIGDSGIVPEEYNRANLTENAAKVCDLHGIYNQYLALVFQSRIIQDQIQNKIFSASQGKLALSRIRQFLIPLPPLPEQQEIVRRVDALFAFADSIEANVSAARDKTEKLRQSILAKAFSGQLVETEAAIAKREGRDYEAAEILLEKIRAEKGNKEKKR